MYAEIVLHMFNHAIINWAFPAEESLSLEQSRDMLSRYTDEGVLKP